MGCGLSQLSRVHRIQVLDATLPSSKCLIRAGRSDQLPISPAHPKPFATNELPSVKKSVETSSSPAKSVVPPARKFSGGVYMGPEQPASIYRNAGAAEVMVSSGAPRVEDLAPTRKDVAPVSCMSVKSLSDHDSGYKDDPDSMPDDSTSESDHEAGKGRRSWRTRVTPDNPNEPPHLTLNEHDLPVAGSDGKGHLEEEDDFSEDCFEGGCRLVHGSAKCASCGFTHAKQDGYVETYDDGFVDSSYEELRSLAHEGSVFSMDILCHNTMDGSQKTHKIPLFVHKPVQPMQQVYAEQRRKGRQLVAQREKAAVTKDNTFDLHQYFTPPVYQGYTWQTENHGGVTLDHYRNKDTTSQPVQRSGSMSDNRTRRSRYANAHHAVGYPHTHTLTQTTTPARTSNLYGFAGLTSENNTLFPPQRPVTGGTLDTDTGPAFEVERTGKKSACDSQHEPNDDEIRSLHE